MRIVYSDSDWAGCREKRRSTDCYIAVVCGAIVACGTQTNRAYQRQVRRTLLRGVSRAAREAIFLKELITRDFGQQCGKPRLWTDVHRQCKLPSALDQVPNSDTLKSVISMCARSFAVQADSLGQSQGHRELCQLPHQRVERK